MERKLIQSVQRATEILTLQWCINQEMRGEQMDGRMGKNIMKVNVREGILLKTEAFTNMSINANEL